MTPEELQERNSMLMNRWADEFSKRGFAALFVVGTDKNGNLAILQRGDSSEAELIAMLLDIAKTVMLSQNETLAKGSVRREKLFIDPNKQTEDDPKV